MNKYLLLILFLLASTRVFGDTPARPFPYVVPSQYGSFYFKMIPQTGSYENGAYHVDSLAYGVAYKLLDDGSSEELWSVEGWYAFRVFLSRNGEYLVRMGNWASGSEPSSEDLAVAFYHNGILLKEYSTADLIDKKGSVRTSVSHYEWQSDDADYPRMDYQNMFLIKTIESKIYRFDIETGEIVEVKKG